MIATSGRGNNSATVAEKDDGLVAAALGSTPQSAPTPLSEHSQRPRNVPKVAQETIPI